MKKHKFTSKFLHSIVDQIVTKCKEGGVVTNDDYELLVLCLEHLRRKVRDPHP